MLHSHLRHWLAGTISVASLAEALGSNSFVAVAAAIAAVVTTLWGAWRREKRADFEVAEYERMTRALVDAKIKAFHQGKPDPWPHLSVPGFPIAAAATVAAKQPEEPKTP